MRMLIVVVGLITVSLFADKYRREQAVAEAKPGGCSERQKLTISPPAIHGSVAATI